MEALSLWRLCGSLFFLLLPLLLPIFSMQQATPFSRIYQECLRNTTLLSTAFTRNLDAALLNFTSLSSQGSKYANSTASGGSSGDDMVYAVFQCRGDLSTQSCTQCVQYAAQLRQVCPESVGARFRLDGCFLRYDNQSFFSLDTDVVSALCNTANLSDVVTLRAIGDLMQRVTSEAPKQGGWASARASGMYGAAQCVGYLSQAECAMCLTSSSYRVYCDSSKGAQLHLASCDIRYDAYDFLEATAAAAPGPASLVQPARARSRADTEKEQDSKGSDKEEGSQKGAEAKGPLEHEPSDQEDTSTPLDRKIKKPRTTEQILLDEAMARVEARKKKLAVARAAKAAKINKPTTMEEARKARMEKAKAIQEERRRLEAD
ncbi:hypothetical protein L7F22_051849 [Adiantum nelumboides]|nr:hypothetical protein [Adiantum nelumboides]